MQSVYSTALSADWARLFVFQIVLIHLGKEWIQLFSSSRRGYLIRDEKWFQRRKNLNSKLTLLRNLPCHILLMWRGWVSIYIYIYIHTHTHTHTHVYIYIYIYICAHTHTQSYVCWNLCMCSCKHAQIFFIISTEIMCILLKAYIKYNKFTFLVNKTLQGNLEIISSI